MKNAPHHACVIIATKCVLIASPYISNKALASIMYSQFSDIDVKEVKRSIDLALLWFKTSKYNVGGDSRNYKELKCW